MNIATLKVYGDETALADVRDGLPSEPENAWQKGEPGPSGRTHIDAGFFVTIGTDPSPAVVLQQIRAYLAECQARGITFDAANIAAELRVAYAGGEALDFSLADLELLLQMGVTLSITS
ncbi:hypothetical protein [Pseudoduganella sp. RAF53_2]|jgi:hypothetical protein|uniref:hypothetical protein n=1 Tax=unclassified Pseudoduganella TaxID=2637179 RepID=UPI003F9A92D1